MDPRSSRIIIANFFVSKNLKTRPAHAIKFIIINRDYFPNISDIWLDAVKKEHNITDEMLDSIKDIEKFEPINNDHEAALRKVKEEKEKIRLARLAQKFARDS